MLYINKISLKKISTKEQRNPQNASRVCDIFLVSALMRGALQKHLMYY